MGIVDVWGQIPTERMIEQPWLDSLKRWTAQTSGDMLHSTKDTLDRMDQAGIETMLLSAWYGPDGVLVSNEDVARRIDEAPDRFRGLAGAPLSTPMEAVREIRHWVDGERFVGVRVVPWLWNLPPDHRQYYPVYTTCCELDVPVCTQVGHTGPLLPSEPGRPIPYLENVMLDFPDLTVVGGHVGFPWLDEITSLLHKFPNFYLDTSAYVLHRLPPAFIDLMKSAGKKRVMFGTNYPMLDPVKCLTGIDALGLDEDAKSEFLFGTAKRVFRL